MLVIDDSGIPKKGTKSAGVAPQSCGARHAVVNCQVGVVACEDPTEVAWYVAAGPPGTPWRCWRG